MNEDSKTTGKVEIFLVCECRNVCKGGKQLDIYNFGWLNAVTKKCIVLKWCKFINFGNYEVVNSTD